MDEIYSDEAKPVKVLPFRNPYTPGAGHPPPYLAGRQAEQDEFDKLLGQTTILENMVLTGLRGVGKTVLLEVFKVHALQQGWMWAGNDLSESASVSEETLAIRLMTDLSIAASGVSIEVPVHRVGFQPRQQTFETMLLSFDVLAEVYSGTPGLVADRIRAVLEYAWSYLKTREHNRLIFAYDEAQNLGDHADKEQFPLSILLDVFQSIQRRGIPFMLVLTGLPTLLPKLVEARTYAERMFRVVTLSRLSTDESREAIIKPIEETECPIQFNDESVETIVSESAGYPYFIQFICREVFDIFIQQETQGTQQRVPFDSLQRKLDTDFFSGRWAKVTDRQRELLWIISSLPTADDEFTIQEIVEASKKGRVKEFSSSHVNRMLLALSEQGLVYKNRFGKYSFAVPLLGSFISRTYRPAI
jgi:hypothetical protein